MIKHQNNVAIMQPHFFPRAAYFKLILKSDTFVVLNNVPFERQSWQSRNRILTKNGILYINLPTVKSKLGTEIQNILVKPFNNWLPKLERTLRQNYAKSFFKDDFKILMNEIFNQNFLSTPGAIFLADFNIKIIQTICNLLDIKFNPIFSSDLDTVGVRSNRLIDILTKLNGTTYLAVEGSRQYLEEDNFSKKIDLEVSFINLDHNPYEHVHNKEFIPNLSVVDMIASLGFEQTKKFLE